MDTVVPRMQAETGYELDDSIPPLRVSGFICLIFGLLSALCLLGQPLVVLPVAAFITGAIALRRSGGQTPVGTRPAMLGIVLAAGFGACGLLMPWLKTVTLGRQAAHFSRNYMDVIALGHDEFALELHKDYVNRFPTTMSLTEHYSLNEGSQRELMEFKDKAINKSIRKRGVGAEWILDRPVNVYFSYGREHAEVVWADPTGQTGALIQFFMEYRVDSNGDGQWHIKNCQTYRERLVAESIL